MERINSVKVTFIFTKKGHYIPIGILAAPFTILLFFDSQDRWRILKVLQATKVF